MMGSFILGLETTAAIFLKPTYAIWSRMETTFTKIFIQVQNEVPIGP
jgi:hypothetical protein